MLHRKCWNREFLKCYFLDFWSGNLQNFDGYKRPHKGHIRETTKCCLLININEFTTTLLIMAQTLSCTCFITTHQVCHFCRFTYGRMMLRKTRSFNASITWILLVSYFHDKTMQFMHIFFLWFRCHGNCRFLISQYEPFPNKSIIFKICNEPKKFFVVNIFKRKTKNLQFCCLIRKAIANVLTNLTNS